MDSIAFFITEILENRRSVLKNLRINTMDIFSMTNTRYVCRKIIDLPFNPENSFKKNFRINKEAFKYILLELEDRIKSEARLGCLRPIDKVAACLRFFAEGNYQHGVGKDNQLNISQSTFSKILSEVLVAFEEILCPKWISAKMDDETQEDARMHFFQKSSIPGVVMAVDGTHVKIFTPSVDRHLFYNRKGYHSINVMLVNIFC